MQGLEIYLLISVAELPVPVMALAVSELSSPGARAGTDPTSVPCWPERVLGSTGPSDSGKSLPWLHFFNYFFYMGLKPIEIVLVKNKNHQFSLPSLFPRHLPFPGVFATGSWLGGFSPGVLSVIYKALVKKMQKKEKGKKNQLPGDLFSSAAALLPRSNEASQQPRLQGAHPASFGVNAILPSAFPEGSLQPPLCPSGI